MLRLTLAQMRRSLPRLSAAAIAIAISTAFVAASFLASDAIQQATFDHVAARYAAADLILTRPDGRQATHAELRAVQEADGVAEATGLMSHWFSFRAGERTIWVQTLPTAPEGLLPVVLSSGVRPGGSGPDDIWVDGAWPTGPAQVALSRPIAERLGVEVGDEVWLERGSLAVQDADLEAHTVTGLVDDPHGAFTLSGGVAVMDSAALLEYLTVEGRDPDGGWFWEIAVQLSPGVSAESAGRTLTADGWQVTTPHQLAAELVATQTGGEDLMFLVFVLTFAAIALLVAALVIANTFQVLVAQRTATLATLRAIGAQKRQVGQAVVSEALILGVFASLLGVTLGGLLVQGALTVLRGGDGVAATLPASVPVTPRAVLVPLAAGVVVTLLAARVPARLASRVAPLAALRPEPSATLEKGSAGRVRLACSTLASLLGFGLLAAGVYLSNHLGEPTRGLLAGLAGGALSFVGVAASAVFWMPRFTALAGRLAGLTGPIARLAAANTARNPRRTAATATALLIGVTLVTMMSTGAASARASLTATLHAHYPTDLVLETATVTCHDDGACTRAPLPTDLIGAVSAEPGVSAVAALTTATVLISGQEQLPPPADAAPEGDAEGEGVSERGGNSGDADREPDAGWEAGQRRAGGARDQLSVTSVYAVDPSTARAAISDPALLDGLTEGVILLPAHLREQWDTPSGIVCLREWDDEAGHGEPQPGPNLLPLRAVFATGRGLAQPVIALPDLAALGLPTAPTQLWLSLSDLGAVGRIQDLVADSDEAIAVEGNALERAQLETVIDTILAVVIGLLAVAVVISLIGVANTLSLSVIERRKESATLRAIGVTRGQLRAMLAVEGVLIAAVGVALGIALGLAYGWGGSLTVLGVLGPVELSVPWREIGVICVVALAAGLLASALPGRRAAKEPPVAALAAT